MESEPLPPVSVPQPAPTPQPTSSPQSAPSKPKRPWGVTFLGVLFILGGIIGIGNGSAAMTGLFLESVGHITQTDIFVGLIGFPSGIISVMIAFSFFKPKGWSWKAAIIFIGFDMVETIITSILSANYFTSPIIVIIDLLILYYLFRPNVKRYFGKNASPTSPNVPPTATSDSPNKI
jgi:hypothetical protein